MRNGASKLVLIGMPTVLKNTPTKHIKYVVNQKLEHCDDVSSRGRFVKIPGVFLSYKIPIHDGVAIAFFMKRSRANLLIGLLVLSILGNKCVQDSKPTERGVSRCPRV